MFTEIKTQDECINPRYLLVPTPNLSVLAVVCNKMPNIQSISELFGLSYLNNDYPNSTII
jgi:hypothetical protein